MLEIVEPFRDDCYTEWIEAKPLKRKYIIGCSESPVACFV